MSLVSTVITIGTIPVALALLVWGTLQPTPRSDGTRVPRRWPVSIERIWQLEFWPAWFFYLPLVPWYLYLSLRHGGVTVWTAANPGIPAGGLVGESKSEILRNLDQRFVTPTVYLPPASLAERLQAAASAITAYPVILKPDAGQRGAGVRKVEQFCDVERYLRANPDPIVIQRFHPGPYEVGMFYYRLPSEPQGTIFSATDKVFPVVVGDGQSTLAELIQSHPRYRMQESVFRARHATELGRVLNHGQPFPLATAGNHCQGTLFRDGAHLITPELTAALEQTVRPFTGFYFGRFDLRYSDPDALRAGHGFEIVELNGATSESTNLYDPKWSIGRAYSALFRQWSLAFRIGAQNRRRGHTVVSALEVVRLLRQFYHQRSVRLLSD